MSAPCPHPAVYDRGECCGKCPTTQQDSVDVERLRAAITDAIGKADTAFGYSFNLTRLVDGEETHTLTMPGHDRVDFDDRDEGYALIAERRNRARADAVLAALSLPITQRDEQGDRTYADGIADAAKVADQEADDIKQHAHLASDAWQQGREAMARTIATAIRRLSIEQGDQDGGEG